MSIFRAYFGPIPSNVARKWISVRENARVLDRSSARLLPAKKK